MNRKSQQLLFQDTVGQPEPLATSDYETSSLSAAPFATTPLAFSKPLIIGMTFRIGKTHLNFHTEFNIKLMELQFAFVNSN